MKIIVSPKGLLRSLGELLLIKITTINKTSKMTVAVELLIIIIIDLLIQCAVLSCRARLYYKSARVFCGMEKRKKECLAVTPIRA